MITVKFFAMLRNLAGTEVVEYEADGGISIEDLKERVKGDFPKLSDIIDARSVFISINQEFAERGAVVRDGDEVAFLPPFSGG